MSTLNPATRVSPIREQYVANQVVLVLNEDTALVASRSHAGDWHTVTAGACTCDGYRFRHTCAHLNAAQLAARPVVPTPAVCTPVVRPITCLTTDDGAISRGTATPAPSRPRLFEGRSILAAFAVEEDEHGHPIPAPTRPKWYNVGKEAVL